MTSAFTEVTDIDSAFISVYTELKAALYINLLKEIVHQKF